MALDPNRIQEIENGIRINDGDSSGPIFTGGPTSPVGLDFPEGTLYVQNVPTGPVIWKKWGVGINDWAKQMPSDFYQDASALPETSTNSRTVYLNKGTLVTPDLPLGKYRIGWRYKWRAANKNRGIRFQVVRNTIEISNTIAGSSLSQDNPVIGSFLTLDNLSGVQTFNFNFRVGIGNTTVFVSELYIEFWRVA